jgi:hypothetical protein
VSRKLAGVSLWERRRKKPAARARGVGVQSGDFELERGWRRGMSEHVYIVNILYY